MKQFFTISAIVASFFCFLHNNPSYSENIELIYWGAKDCPPCKAWEKAHKSDVKSELSREGGSYIEVMKTSLKDKFSFHHAGKSKIAMNIIIAKPPSFVPHYTYTKDGEQLFDISGINSWKSQHTRIMDSLLK